MKIELEPNLALDENYHLVLYGDGSADNIQREYGVGFTGYLYTEDTKNKPSSDKPNRYTITNIGYLENELLGKYKYDTVIPKFYIEGMIGYEDQGTNNVAELKAFIEPIEYLFRDNINQCNIRSILFKSDSSYTLLVLDYLYNNPKEIWGNKITANLELVNKINDIITLLKDNKIKLKWQKVIGHSTSLGNNIADRLALHGRIHKCRIIELVPTKKHWSKSFDIHPLLRFKQAFFMTSEVRDEPMYIIMDYKTGEEVGKKTHDALFGITILEKEEDMLKDAVDAFTNRFGTTSLLSTVDLKVLSTRNVLYYYSIFGKNSYRYEHKNKSLLSLDNDCICRNVYPPGLAIQAYEKINFLYMILSEYRNNKPIENRIFTDVTDKFYSIKTTKKTEKRVCSIPIGENISVIELDVYGKKIQFNLVLGTDMPSRNQMKAIEDNIDKVILSSIKINKMIDYQIIIETKNKEYGIYTNLYSCKVFLK